MSKYASNTKGAKNFKRYFKAAKPTEQFVAGHCRRSRDKEKRATQREMLNKKKSEDDTVAGHEEDEGWNDDEGGKNVLKSSSISVSTDAASSSDDDRHYHYSIRFFGKKYACTAFEIFRVAFYLLMVYNWNGIYHGPCKFAHVSFII